MSLTHLLAHLIRHVSGKVWSPGPLLSRPRSSIPHVRGVRPGSVTHHAAAITWRQYLRMVLLVKINYLPTLALW